MKALPEGKKGRRGENKLDKERCVLRECAAGAFGCHMFSKDKLPFEVADTLTAA